MGARSNVQETEIRAPKRRFAIWIVAALSILLNIVLVFSLRMSSALFATSVYWNYGLELQGVLLFNDKTKQPDPKKLVQHISIKCDWEKQCRIVETTLMGEYIFPNISELEVLELNLEEQTATFEWQKCRIQVVGKQSSFICKDGDTGVIGSHIELFHDRYGLF
ncbi:MAG: hypothetical protein U1D69_09760 [Polynucleobacter sp.]|nr:hypothetical protein [Polynucleobacter sp.]